MKARPQVISNLARQIVDLIRDEVAKGDGIVCNGVEMVREKVEEPDKFVYDEYYADGVVYEDLFSGEWGSGEDDFVVREYLDEYSDLRLDFRSGSDHCLVLDLVAHVVDVAVFKLMSSIQ